MSRQITQPVNQVRLTNVAVVRMNRHGKRFEVACYRNKAVNFRQGIETDLSEVLQTDRVFANVSKGEFAKSSDLKRAFSTVDQDSICRTILLEGQLQVSDMERAAQFENTTREIATLVQEKCVNPQSNRPYTLQVIRQAMKDAEFKVHPTRGVKQQFLTCVELLKKKGVIEIQRAKMHLCVHLQLSSQQQQQQQQRVEVVKEALHKIGASVLLPTAESTADPSAIHMLIDPRLYRQVDAMVKDASICGPNARLEIVKQCAIEEGDVGLQSELERRQANTAATTPMPPSLEEEDVETAMDNLTLQTQQEDNNQQDDKDTAEPSPQNNNNHHEKPTNHYDALLLDDDDDDSHDKNSDLDDDDDEMNEKPAKPPSAAALAKSIMAQKKAQQQQQQQHEQQGEEHGGKSKKKKKKRGKKGKKQQQPQQQPQPQQRDDHLEEGELQLNASNQQQTRPTSTNPPTATTTTTSENAKSCNTCGGAFETSAAYRAHFRSDWHRYNLKLKMSGAPPVSLEEYQLCDGALLHELVSM